MADHTVAGIVAIALIVLVASVFLAYFPNDTNLAGEASFQGSEVCEPASYCDGSKLVIVRDDCTVGYSFCQFGCNAELSLCR